MALIDRVLHLVIAEALSAGYSQGRDAAEGPGNGFRAEQVSSNDISHGQSFREIMPTPLAWLIAFIFLIELSALTSASSAPYVVEGFTLGQPIPRTGASYLSYSCEPSHRFDGFTSCRREDRRHTSLGSSLFSSKIIHDEDGISIYLMANLEPVSMDRNTVDNEIDQLSRELNERPREVKWLPERPGVPTSVIALWGRLELEELDPGAVEIATQAIERPAGILEDPLGNLTRATKAGLPVYRLSGGPGYLYSASFDANGRGRRHYVAANISVAIIKMFERAPEGSAISAAALHKVLQEDRPRAGDDYGLWPEVHNIARKLALQTSPSDANRALDKIFDQYPSRKLRSHVWAFLPLGTQWVLQSGRHWVEVIYGPQTQYPRIRRSIQRFLADRPTEPFSEFLYYTIGEFEKGLQTNPKSPIRSLLNYAAGYKILQSLLAEIRKLVPVRACGDAPCPQHAYQRDWTPVNDTFIVLNQNAELLFGNRLLGSVVPRFATQATIAKPYFEAVLRDQASPLRDDAAYMLGWLALHQGKFREAMEYTSQAIALEEEDYARPAKRQMARVLVRLPMNEVITLIESNPGLAEERELWWYVAVRGAYRNFDYELAVETGEKALKAMDVPLDLLPATTNVARISEALEKLDLRGGELSEIIYVIEASREILEYEDYLKTVATERPDDLAKRARAIVLKYSLLIRHSEPNFEEVTKHKDLRQAVHLIEMTLDAVPRDGRYTALREWLHYRKVRDLAQWDPRRVSEAVGSMEQEFPKSRLMAHALAEQIYAEGARMENIELARKAFQKIASNFPTSDAADNAYTWMAISYHCAGRSESGQNIDREIIRRFPLTRHAEYARNRLSHPERSGCAFSIFSVRGIMESYQLLP